MMLINLGYDLLAAEEEVTEQTLHLRMSAPGQGIMQYIDHLLQNLCCGCSLITGAF